MTATEQVMHVFSYGTLMFPDVWRAVVRKDFAQIEGMLQGYAIYRVRNEEFPGIVPADASQSVSGVLYLDVDDRSVRRLDRFEGTFYRRETVTVQCNDGWQRQGAAYIVDDWSRPQLLMESWRCEEFVASGGLRRFLARYGGILSGDR